MFFLFLLFYLVNVKCTYIIDVIYNIGLFQKVFSQSGTALCPWTIAENVPDKSAAVGAYLGCPTRPSKDLVKCLKTRPALHIVEAVKIFLVSTAN